MNAIDAMKALRLCAADDILECNQCALYGVDDCTHALKEGAASLIEYLTKQRLEPKAEEVAPDMAKADQGSHLRYEERKAIYREAIDRWGSYSQIWMSVEEMSELTNALCKFRRDRCSVHDVAEEIADVTIMMEQLRLIFDINEEVSGIMDKKVRRLQQRISLGKEGEHG